MCKEKVVELKKEYREPSTEQVAAKILDFHTRAVELGRTLVRNNRERKELRCKILTTRKEG